MCIVTVGSTSSDCTTRELFKDVFGYDFEDMDSDTFAPAGREDDHHVLHVFETGGVSAMEDEMHLGEFSFPCDGLNMGRGFGSGSAPWQSDPMSSFLFGSEFTKGRRRPVAQVEVRGSS